MHTHTNNDPPLRGPIIDRLLELAAKTPTFLLERLVTTRTQLQSYHPSLCPAVLKIQEGGSNGESVLPWISDDRVAHGFLVHNGDQLLMTFPNVCATKLMSGRFALHPGTLEPSQWLNAELRAFIEQGRPLVTLYEHGPEPTEWVEAIDELISSFRNEALRGFEATPVDLDDKITPAGFLEALDGFPDQFVEAMCTLAGEIDHLVGHIAFLAGNGQEEREFEQCDEISKACIAALVPGIRALAFHGFGWPILPPADAKNFLGKIRDVQPVSVETIASLSGNLDSEQREKLLSFLLKAGLVSMKDSLISVVEPADFLAAQFITHAPEGNADRTEHLA